MRGVWLAASRGTEAICNERKRDGNVGRAGYYLVVKLVGDPRIREQIFHDARHHLLHPYHGGPPFGFSDFSMKTRYWRGEGWERVGEEEKLTPRHARNGFLGWDAD